MGSNHRQCYSVEGIGPDSSFTHKTGTLLFTTLIPARISNHMPAKVWYEIIYPFPNFNGADVEVWEWISNCIPRFTRHVVECRNVKGQLELKTWDKYNKSITHPCRCINGSLAQETLMLRQVWVFTCHRNDCDDLFDFWCTCYPTTTLNRFVFLWKYPILP